MSESPAYIDLQVNGYGGVDFNRDDLTAEQLHTACAMLDRDGVSGMLATIITDHVDLMARRLARLAELREQDELATRIVVGFHIEGPFLNPAEGYRGAHPLQAVRPAEVDAMRRLLDAAGGLTRIVTLAPECDEGLAVTRMLSDRGVIVSGGHSDASLGQIDAALDAGLSMYTHLGNGCPMMMSRHDNIINRVLSRSERFKAISFIADGVHIPFFALANYLQRVGAARVVVVSDAMAAAGMGPGVYQLGQWAVEVGEDLSVWAPGRQHLVGSAMSMARAATNLREHMGISDSRIGQWTMRNAAQLLGM